MNIEKLKCALALKSVEGLGNVGYNRLISRFGAPENVLQQSIDDLVEIGGIHRKTAQALASFKSWGKVEREIKLAEQYGARIIAMEDPDYPELLRSVPDCPALLYVKGTLIADEACIAVVGSRRAGTYGKFSTEKICRELSCHGLNIVSGMARGIDSAAHRGALSGNGRTVAVLGCGLDIIYPPENRKLFDQIVETGAVISEFPFQTQPLAAHFPVRNRIISGMALGVVVMEATEKSGSLITAHLALEQGREVFAVPGNIDQPGSKGTHKLIKEGAKLVESVSDILDEIAHRLKKEGIHPGKGEPARKTGALPQSNEFDAVEESILNILAEPLHLDEILNRTGIGGSAVLNSLLILELKGFIEQLPGKIFRKTDRMTIQ